MAKYEVRYKEIVTITIVVEADNEEDAIQAAYDECDNTYESTEKTLVEYSHTDEDGAIAILLD